MNKKLMFVLCRSCGESFNRYDCEQTEEERALTGTCVAEKVVKAIEVGYTVLQIYELWTYNVEQCSRETKTGALFLEYISKFLAIKHQASG